MRPALLPLITSKSDVETALRLVDLGYPRVAPVLPFMLEWIQDCNWPVAGPLLQFFKSIGQPMIPEIRRVFATNDDTWKYWCIGLLQSMEPAVVEELRPELIEMALRPTSGEEFEGVAERAIELLLSLDQSGRMPKS